MNTSVWASISPANDSVASAAVRAPKGRLASLDALRGFDMFWILGGSQLVHAIAVNAEEGSFPFALKMQFTHVKWVGFHFFDFIFPLFLFTIGMSVPIAIGSRLARGDTKGRILRHAFIRFGWMIFFGFWVNGRILTLDPEKMRLGYSVLMMLGAGYMIAVVLVLYTSIRAQILTTVGTLVAYWGLQMFVPVPGFVPGEYQENAIFSDWLHDHTVGTWEAPWYSPIGRGWPLMMWMRGTSAMLGVFAIYLLRSQLSEKLKIQRLLILGVACLAAGWIWGLHFPIAKPRWTSSFVLWCGGFSFLLLALFYWLIDVRGWKGWSEFFVTIGRNSILAYIILSVFMGGFRSFAATLFGGLERWIGPYWHGIWMVFASYGLAWLLLAYLRKQEIYLRL